MSSSQPSTSSENRPKRLTSIQASYLLDEIMAEERNSEFSDVIETESDDSLDESEVRFDSDSESESSEIVQQSKIRRVTTSSSSTSRPSTSASVAIDASSWVEFPQGATIGNSLFRTGCSGVQAELDETSTPLKCFNTLFNNAIGDQLILDINSFAEQRITQQSPLSQRSTLRDWVPIGRCELFKLLAVLIAMGMNKKNDIKNYWSTVGHKYTPWYKLMFGRTKFLLIFQTMLHACEPLAIGKSKIEPFVEALIGNFQQAFYPFENLSIDEMVIGFKGRFYAKQYNPSKPSKYHIKTFGLCDSVTGYVFDILIYFGANTSYDPDTDPTSQHAIKVFDRLLRKITGRHHIFADRFYTSLPLIQHLQTRQLNCTGTVQTNRKGLPRTELKAKHAHGESRWLCNNNVLCVSWQDKKKKNPVAMLTTHGSHAFVDVVEGRRALQKPSPIHAYNKSMNGCDRLDQMVSYYGLHNRKAYKWWKKVFTWILEVVQVNAHILFCLCHPDMTKKMPLSQFKDALIGELSRLAEVEIPANITLAAANQPGQRAITAREEPCT